MKNSLVNLTKRYFSANLLRDKYMKLAYLIAIAALLLINLTTKPVFAAGSCQNIYNGGTVCNQTNGSLTIEKTVLNPINKQYTNNLRQDQYVFLQGQTLSFHLKLSNTSKSGVSNITITDPLPVNLDFTGGDGTFDSSKHILTIKLNQLAPNSSQTYNYQTTVNNSAIPGSQVDACLLNTVSVSTTSFFFFTSLQSQSSASFCISSQQAQSNSTGGSNNNLPTSTNNANPTPTPVVLGHKPTVYTAPKTKQTPPTGPEAASLVVLPLFAFIGRKLQQKAK